MGGKYEVWGLHGGNDCTCPHCYDTDWPTIGAQGGFAVVCIDAIVFWQKA